jgi:hypothetical protein
MCTRNGTILSRSQAISHGVARIAEFLYSDSPEVIAHGFVSPLLKSMGESEIIDELPVIISEQVGTIAYFTFSSQMRPDTHEFRIYDNKNGLIVDPDTETLTKLPDDRYKAIKVIFRYSLRLIIMARQHLESLKTHRCPFHIGKFF